MASCTNVKGGGMDLREIPNLNKKIEYFNYVI